MPQFSITEGTLIPAILLSEINSDLPGPILGQVSENIYDTRTGKSLLIPQGSKLIGEYSSSVSFGQQRAQVVWSRLILPNTESVNLGRMPGLDRQGASGIAGKVDAHYDQLAMGALVTSILSAGLALSAGNSNPNSNTLTPAQQLGQATAQGVMQFGTKVAEKVLDVPPTIKVKAGTKIQVFSTSDIQLKRYQS